MSDPRYHSLELRDGFEELTLEYFLHPDADGPILHVSLADEPDRYGTVNKNSVELTYDQAVLIRDFMNKYYQEER